MNKKVEFNYQQTGLTKEDVLTPGEIEKYKKTFDMQKVKKGTVAAVGASTILVSSLTANADFSPSKFIPKDVFGKKVENTIMVEEKEEAEIEIVETKEKVVAEKKAKATTEKEKVVTPKEEKPAYQRQSC